MLIAIVTAAGTETTPKGEDANLSNRSADDESIEATFFNLPLSFMENRDQETEVVEFMVKAQGQTIFFTSKEVVFVTTADNNTSAVRMGFQDARPALVQGEETLPGVANFFIGNDSAQWVTEVPTHAAIRYQEIYPGIDLVFKGDEGSLKHEFLVKPGADPDQIIITYEGQKGLRLAEDESLIIETEAGNLTDAAPICYQVIDDDLVSIEGRYAILDQGQVGFEVGGYDPSYALVIDPALRYSTYLGGSGTDWDRDIIVDENGYAYVTGYTGSTNYPTENPYQGTKAGDFDAFVSKFSLDGSALIYSTYLGGSTNDYGWGIATDQYGNAYVAGHTSSTDFPTADPYQGTNAGSSDLFVAKIDPTGSDLTYSTYLGGSSNDYCRNIAADEHGNAYVTGKTYSIDFPTENPFQGAKAGDYDVFVTKINSAGTNLAYSTYLGGSDDDEGHGIALDLQGNAYVAGTTSSSNFPTKNPYQGSNAGYTDVFVTKIKPDGSALAYSTYIGGTGNDRFYDVALDQQGCGYITGDTQSTDFPTMNAIQEANAGLHDIFITKFNSAGSALIYSTYLGGSSDDMGQGIALDQYDNAYVAGYTSSDDFPTVNPYQGTYAGAYDAIVAKLNSAGSDLVYSTYLGGINTEYCYCIALDQYNNAHISGVTSSGDFPTMNPFQGSMGGSIDAFVAVLEDTSDSGGWLGYSGSIDKGPLIAQDLEGRRHMLAKGSDNCLWDNVEGRWQSLGGTLAYAPSSVVLDCQGRMHIIYRGSGDALCDCVFDTSGWSWQHQSLGGVIASQPGAALDPASGHIMIAAVGSDGALWLMDLDPLSMIGGWTWIGQGVDSNPQVIYDSLERRHILIRLDSGAVYDNVDGTWLCLGGIVTSDTVPVLDPTSPDKLRIFCSAGGSLWMASFDATAGTTAWTDLGGGLLYNPAPLNDLGGLTRAFVIGGDNALWECLIDPSGGSVWLSHGGRITGGAITESPAASSDEEGTVPMVALKGGDGRLWVYKVR